MGTILFAWQLGAGLGHLLRMKPSAEGLANCGHRIFMVARNLPRAAKVYARLGVSLLQSPAKSEGPCLFRRGSSFAHLLANVGFGTFAEIFGLVAAWRNLFELVQPDLIVFDHSPAALLAARGFPARRVPIGSGYCCPPDTYPLAKIRADVSPDEAAKAQRDEDRILQRLNAILKYRAQPTLERLGQLYGEVDECFLTTFEELDHYPGRSGATYWGPVNGSGGKSPDWPAANGRRIFAYLKPFPTLTDLLEILNDRKYPTLIYPDGIDREIQERYQSDTLRFVNERLNMSEVSQQCDLAILNAGHGTTCDILLAGRPILQFPLQAEQQLMAENVCRLGAGETLSPRQKDRAAMEITLDQLLIDPRYTEAAQRFAQRYANFNPQRQQAQMLQRVLELLDQPSPKPVALPPTPVASACDLTAT
jgi:UDP:flavonoid glycosyltransferase YjiC (YdhE family)